MTYKEVLKKVEDFSKYYCELDKTDSTLWKDHVRLVRKYALMLARLEKADKHVVEIASLLHDIGKYKGRDEHNVRSYELAKEFLEKLNVEKKELILKCILKHSSRFSEEENEIEVKVVQSADGLGTLFDEGWQSDWAKNTPRDLILKIFDKTLYKLNLESAKKIAIPQIKKLKLKLK